MSVLDKLRNLFSVALLPNKKSDGYKANCRSPHRTSLRNNNYRKVTILTSKVNKLPSALNVTSDMRVFLLRQWCRENDWSKLQKVDLQFYATPPNGFIPVPLPKEALAELEDYRKVVDILQEIQLLRVVSEVSKDNALFFTGFCLLSLCLKEVFKMLPNPGDIHQLINLAIALSIVIALPYTWMAVSSYWEQRWCKSKLSRMPRFVDLLARLEMYHARNVY